MRNDHFSMLPEKAFQPRNGRTGMTLEGGGGGTSTTVTSNIPEWLQPQTEALLGAATKEYFQTTPVGGKPAVIDSDGNVIQEAKKPTYDITGVKPFTPYSTRPSDYFAGFSPQQEQVFAETAALKTPGAFTAASDLMGAAGRGALESVIPAYAYGQQGQRSGILGQGVGMSYGQMATDPRAIQAYMSPYQQAVTDVAKREAIENAERAQLGANLGAARQGTYGGARQTLAQGQREAALQKTLSDLDVRGRQEAFESGRQAQQFGVSAGIQGAGLGMQGAQLGLQGLGAAQAGYGMAGQVGQGLAGLGQSRQAADLQRIAFQGEMGAIPQAQQQKIIDQAIQNYALAQESPFSRLSQYSGILRGYATPTMTTESYRATNPAQTLAALGTTAAGFTMPGRKKGGVIEEGIDSLAIRKAKRKKVAA